MDDFTKDTTDDYLIRRLLEGDLSLQEADELENRLQESPEIVSRIEPLREIDYLLRLQQLIPHASPKRGIDEADQEFLPPLWEMLAEKQFVKSEALFQPQISTRDALALQAYEVESNRREISGRVGTLRTANFSKGTIGLLLGLACLFGYAVWLEFHPSRIDSAFASGSFRPIAEVSASVDIAWPEDQEVLKTGRLLESSRIIFDKGTMELQLQNGVRVALEGPVNFQLHSASKTFCNSGRVSVTVPKSVKDFEVATPLKTVIDLGTEFCLEVDKTFVRTDVVVGKVLVDRLPQGRLELTPEKAFKIAPNGKSEFLSTDGSRFLSEKKVEERATIADYKDLTQWQKVMESWTKDPNLLLYFDFESSTDRFANQSVSGCQSIPYCTLLGGRIATGRWRNKSAIRFSGKKNGLSVSVPKTLESMTLFTSVRLQPFDRLNQTLFASSSTENGSITWQISRNGTIFLGIHCEDGQPSLYYTSEPLANLRNLSGWYTFAVVLDKKSQAVTHYFDGKPLTRLTANEVVSVRIGEATIGNGFWQKGMNSNRYFDGCFDQFMLFDRPLSATEIAVLHNPTLESGEKP